jgi:hypothetical protein
VGEDENILLEEFVEFFTREDGQSVDNFDDKSLKTVFKEMSKLNVQNIMKKCEEVGVAMTEK